jgi:carboxylate-amine ligase
VELRVMDVQTRVEDTVALAASVQCLVKQILDEIDAGRPPVAYNRMLLSENKWLAARYGLDAPLMDLAAGKRIKMAARTLAKRRLRELRPIARELDCAHQLARVEWMIENGTGAQRQLQVWNANRDLHEVAEELADATEAV